MWMDPCRNWCRRSSLAALWLAALPVWAVQVPAGTALQVRLKTKIASNVSKPKDPVEATVIAPVMVDGAFVIPAGATVRGAVTEARPAADPATRAVLAVDFNELEMGAIRAKVGTVLTGVENARETVNDKGEIQGILASETISARLDAGINKITEKYSGLGEFLETAKKAILQTAEGEIVYGPGVEMDLKLTQPLTYTGTPPPGPVAALRPVQDEAGLVALVNRQPFQSRAQNPPKPSDITTLMFIGTREQVESAFSAAGWSQAAGLDEISKFETFRAIAEQRGYKEAPVSVLYLEGRPPDMVFEKLNNTFHSGTICASGGGPKHFRASLYGFAPRHTIRAWISRRKTGRSFHKIDPQIDKERAKVVNDLLLTGKVKSLALGGAPAGAAPRPECYGRQPGHGREDGRAAIRITRPRVTTPRESADKLRPILDSLYRVESGRILATPVGLLRA